MLIEIDVHELAHPSLLKEWRARVRCDWPECGLTLVLCGFAYPNESVGPNEVDRRVGELGWYRPALGRHLCLSTDAEIDGWLAERERRAEKDLRDWFANR